eukprot:gene16053-17675_t
MQNITKRLKVSRLLRRTNVCLFGSAAGSKEAETISDFNCDQHEDTGRLYEGHEPTTLLQKGLLLLGSTIAALRDPTRSDMVAIFGETTGYNALKKLHKQMVADPVGSQILRERPIINTKILDMDYLRSLPKGTFGKEYTNFMDTWQISSDTRDPVHFVDDEELAYVMTRYRQLHDFTHLLTGFPSITVPAEIAVKWFEMVHYGLPLCTMAATVAPIIISASDRAILRKEVIPWALYAGYRSKLFLNVYFEKHFERDIDELRKDLNVIPCPLLLQNPEGSTAVGGFR